MAEENPGHQPKERVPVFTQPEHSYPGIQEGVGLPAASQTTDVRPMRSVELDPNSFVPDAVYRITIPPGVIQARFVRTTRSENGIYSMEFRGITVVQGNQSLASQSWSKLEIINYNYATESLSDPLVFLKKLDTSRIYLEHIPLLRISIVRSGGRRKSRRKRRRTASRRSPRRRV